MSKSTYVKGGLNGSVRQSVNTGNRANIADLRPAIDDRGLYIDADTQCELMGLIEQLFDQRVNIERDSSIDLPLTPVELRILDMIAKGQHTNRAALLRAAIHEAAALYFHKYRNNKQEK